MADFDKAFTITMGNEGGYSNDPDDAGGETFRGISRRYFPDWEGWKVIDKKKENGEPIPSTLCENEVRSFYKIHFWNVNLLDSMPDELAEEMFDTGVNMGAKQAAKFLQQALSYLNNNGKLYPDLADDGVIGNRTLSALNTIIQKNDLYTLLIIMNVLQGQHYLDYMKKSPEQEKYARGWFSRVTILKN